MSEQDLNHWLLALALIAITALGTVWAVTRPAVSESYNQSRSYAVPVSDRSNAAPWILPRRP